jgi:hypothetical protein
MDDEQQDGSITFGAGVDLEPGCITKEFNENYFPQKGIGIP